MGSWTITRWELKNTIQSRKFLLIFFFQLAVLLMMVLFFNGFMSNIESQQGVGLTPSLNGFASLDVGDSQGIFKNNLNPQILDIGQASNSSLQLISQGKLTGLLLVSKNVSLTNNSISPLESEIFIDYSDPKRSVVRDEVQLAGNKTSAIISQQLINSVSPNSSQAICRTASSATIYWRITPPATYNQNHDCSFIILAIIPLWKSGSGQHSW